MGRTKDMLESDWERESVMDSLFIMESAYEIEEEYQQWLRKQKATLIIGKPRKMSKFEHYGRKTARIIKRRKSIQHHTGGF